MTYSQIQIRNERILAFWAWLNDLNHKDYLRAQRLCIKLFGGFVRGVIMDENQAISLNIET